MSRIGKQVITVPKGVTVTIGERELEVKGAKGTLRTPVPEGITFKQEGDQLQAERANDDLAAQHGLARALANNATQVKLAQIATRTPATFAARVSAR